MAIQSLSEFQSSFGSKPVEVEIDGFATDGQCAKDGAISIYLKPLTSNQRDFFEASVVGVDGKRDLFNLRARLVSLCLVDADGNQIADAEAIGELRADLVGAIFDKVRQLNGMDGEEEAGKD